MLVGVYLRVCVSVYVCVLDGACRSELPTVGAGAGEPAPRGGLAQTVSLAPAGAARRPPGGLGIGADDLPTTHQLATDACSTFRHHLTSYVWGYLLSYYSREGSSYIIMCSQAVTVCSFSPSIYAQGECFLMRVETKV
jgi:hypothetical protein